MGHSVVQILSRHEYRLPSRSVLPWGDDGREGFAIRSVTERNNTQKIKHVKQNKQLSGSRSTSKIIGVKPFIKQTGDKESWPSISTSVLQLGELIQSKSGRVSGIKTETIISQAR